MGKGRHNSDSSLLAKEKALLDSDRISKLPDDILVDIISRLCTREAARTSLLSSRWKYLWTFTTVLNFDIPRKLRCWNLNIDERGRIELDERISKYISWVNTALELHRGSSLNYFKIDFDLGASHKTIITDWIYKAITKKAQKLELDLSPQFSRKRYVFPQEWHDIIKTPSYLSGLRCLTSLSLVYVLITMESIEFFIYNCPLLERLRVKRSEQLSGALKLVGSSIQLKYLDFDCCVNITEIEISAAPRLLSFKFTGPEIKLNIENAPLLLDVSICGINHYVRHENLIDPVRSYLTQLENLELSLNLTEEHFPSLCELPRLKHLTLTVWRTKSKSIIELADIVKACPFLYKFTLKFAYGEFGPFVPEGRRRKPCKFSRYLKVLELIGFAGDPVELEFAFCILDNAINLEKVIVNPVMLYHFGTNYEFEETVEKQIVRKRTKQLKKRARRGVEFILL